MEAREAYFKASQAEVPELIKIATGKEERPPELDTFAAAFAVAGEDQEKATDEETLVLRKRSSRDPGIAKARVEFERAQSVRTIPQRLRLGRLHNLVTCVNVWPYSKSRFAGPARRQSSLSDPLISHRTVKSSAGP